MHGPEIIVRSMSVQRIDDQFGNSWQYHPQSDRHSKIACWSVLFDLLQHSPLLRSHVSEGKVAFGINHKMTDFTADRSKDLDLVLCLPRATVDEPHEPISFAGLVDSYSIELTSEEQAVCASLPPLLRRPVGDVLVALEAKATMAAHVRAGPRLFDELTSAWQCINGSSPNAIAVGFGMVNAVSEFISPKMNKHSLADRPAVITREQQPGGANHALQRFRTLRVRGHTTERGYDAVGVVTILAKNDGSPIVLAPIPPALPPGDPMHYDTMIHRIAGLYHGRFHTR